MGFRPTAFRLAHELGLRGWVRNDAAGAEVALAGPAEDLARFRAELPGRLPAAADMTAGTYRDGDFEGAGAGAGAAAPSFAPDDPWRCEGRLFCSAL